MAAKRINNINRQLIHIATSILNNTILWGDAVYDEELLIRERNFLERYISSDAESPGEKHIEDHKSNPNDPEIDQSHISSTSTITESIYYSQRSSIADEYEIIDVDENTSIEPSTIVVKNLPKDTSQERIRNTFEIYGTVISVKIPVNYYTGQLHLYAFVTFACKESTEDILRGFELGELRIPICMSGIKCEPFTKQHSIVKKCNIQPPGCCKLIFQHISKNTSISDILSIIEHLDVIEIKFPLINGKIHKNYAFILFIDENTCKNAFEYFHYDYNGNIKFDVEYSMNY